MGMALVVWESDELSNNNDNTKLDYTKTVFVAALGDLWAGQVELERW